MMVKFDVKTVNDLLGIDDAFKAPERLSGRFTSKMTATIFGHFLIFWKSLKLISLENS